MAKYIYFDKKLRRKIKKAQFFIGEYELQLQKKIFLYWINCFDWMIYAERSAPKKNDWRGANPMEMSCRFGNRYEYWDEGTMTIYKRCELLFDEYFKEKQIRCEWNKKFESL